METPALELGLWLVAGPGRTRQVPNDRDWSTRGPQVRGQAVSWALPMGRHGRTHRQPVAREKAGQQERWGAPLGLVSITCSRTGVVRRLQPLNAVGRRSADATR